MSKRKYPTDKAFIVGICAGQYVVIMVNKYNNTTGTSKYPTREDAQKVADNYNEKHKQRIARQIAQNKRL